jgi:hypothetical protein
VYKKANDSAFAEEIDRFVAEFLSGCAEKNFLPSLPGEKGVDGGNTGGSSKPAKTNKPIHAALPLK